MKPESNSLDLRRRQLRPTPVPGGANLKWMLELALTPEVFLDLLGARVVGKLKDLPHRFEEPEQTCTETGNEKNAGCMACKGAGYSNQAERDAPGFDEQRATIEVLDRLLDMQILRLQGRVKLIVGHGGNCGG